jgi:hypothetical protein
MVEGRCGPGSFIVTERAVRGEARLSMVRIGGAVVIGKVAALAGVRCVGVPVRVALVAVHVRVGAVQRETRRGSVVVTARYPAIRGVALRAIIGELRLRVVRFHRVVEVRLVTGLARCWSSSKTVRMALHAVHAHVLSGQWEGSRVVIEGGICPRRLIVTCRTIGRESGGRVVRRRRSIVVGDMTGLTCIRCVGVITVVALIATHRNVGPDQRPYIVIIGRWSPPRVGRVAGGAVRRESGGLVVRVRSVVEIDLVAGHALRRGISEGSRGVALVAIIDRVAQREWEEIVIDIVRMPIKAHRVVTFDAIRTEAIRDMVRRLGCLIIVPMATDAIVTDPFELKVIPRGMTLRATQIPMRPDQRESILFVDLRNIVHDPIHRGMATCTIISYGHRMHVRVARSAVRRCRIENQGSVAGLAIDRTVRTFQHKCR